MICKSYIKFASNQKFEIRPTGKTAFKDLRVCDNCKIKSSCTTSKALLNAQFETLKERNIMAKVNGTKVWTNEVTIAFPALLEPQENQFNQSVEYSAMLLIKKSDQETIDKINEAIENVKKINKDSKWGGKIPFNLSVKELKDGDGLNAEGEPYKEYCHGHYLYNLSSKNAPLVVDKRRMPITNPDELYSGFKGIVILNFAAYDFNGRKGITAYLNAVQKTDGGQPIGGSVASANDFELLDEDEAF